MGRLSLACVLVTSMVGLAAAGPTRKVRVETTPPGASVYIDTVENGAVCEATPCTIDAPLGEPTLIIRLDSYEPEFVPVEVKKGKKPIPVSVKLTSSTGTLVIEEPEGAKVKVEGEDRGKVPLSIEIPAEPVRVQVTLGGKTLHDDFVDIDVGQELVLDVDGSRGVASSDDDDISDTFDDDSDLDSDGGSISAKASGARPAYVQAGLAYDLAFRRFSYSGAGDPYTNDFVSLLGPAVELWPGRMLGVDVLRGLSLFARVQFGLASQDVRRVNNSEEVGASTLWGAIEVSLRHKWVFAERLGVEVSGGFARDQVEFNAVSQSALMEVPSADYRSVRLGARASLVGSIEPFVAAENRFVLSGGNLATRADNAETSGYRLAAGLATKLGPLGARVEGSYTQYTWAFDNLATLPAVQSASDKLFFIAFVLGYQY